MHVIQMNKEKFTERTILLESKNLIIINTDLKITLFGTSK